MFWFIRNDDERDVNDQSWDERLDRWLTSFLRVDAFTQCMVPWWLLRI